jgi:uncharacterized protein (TIGR04255 family)
METPQSEPVQLPTKLGQEPLVDAVFEIRFDAAIPASSVFPGILFSGLDGDKKVERLPAADIPQALKGLDQNLKFAPVGRIAWGEFFVLYSDNSLAIACKMPYAGWAAFKNAIEKVLKLVGPTNIISNVHRLGLKYVDLVERSSLKDQIEAVNLKIELAGHELKNEQFQLRFEIERGDCINSIQLIAGVTLSLLNGDQKAGLMVETDTIKAEVSMPMSDFMQKLPGLLEDMHRTNKAVFFDILTDTTIKSLEPQYD